MSSPDWTTISTFATTVAIIMSGFLWLTTRIFSLGKTSERLNNIDQRLDNVESDVKDLRREVQSVQADLSQQIIKLGQRMDQRIDKLILTISESNKR